MAPDITCLAAWLSPEHPASSEHNACTCMEVDDIATQNFES